MPWRRVVSALRLVTVLLCMSAGFAGVAAAGAFVVRDDPGGNVALRVREVEALRAKGTRVEIRGNYCMSSCTLYLGLANLCISPHTKFGFHGPSSQVYGLALPPEEFEHWSRVMAAHYPRKLRGWYLREGRNRIMGFYEISGRELIRMGVRRCI